MNSCPNKDVPQPMKDPFTNAEEVIEALKNGRRIEYYDPVKNKWVPRKKNLGLPNFSKHQYRVRIEPRTFYLLEQDHGDMQVVTELPKDIPEGTKVIEVTENLRAGNVRAKNQLNNLRQMLQSPQFIAPQF